MNLLQAAKLVVLHRIDMTTTATEAGKKYWAASRPDCSTACVVTSEYEEAVRVFCLTNDLTMESHVENMEVDLLTLNDN